MNKKEVIHRNKYLGWDFWVNANIGDLHLNKNLRLTLPHDISVVMTDTKQYQPKYKVNCWGLPSNDWVARSLRISRVCCQCYLAPNSKEYLWLEMAFNHTHSHTPIPECFFSKVFLAFTLFKLFYTLMHVLGHSNFWAQILILIPQIFPFNFATPSVTKTFWKKIVGLTRV